MRIGVMVQSIATIATALIISFLALWQLTLVMLIFMPITIGAGMIQARMIRGQIDEDKSAVEQGGKVRIWGHSLSQDLVL